MTQDERWRGSLTIGDGWAILESVAGANAPHALLACQLTACLDGQLELEFSGQTHTAPLGQYAVIPSGVAHAVGPIGKRLRSIYLDRTAHAPSGLVQTASFGLAEPALSTAINANIGNGLPAALLRAPKSGNQQILSDHPLISLLAFAPPAATPKWVANSLGISASRLLQISHSAFGAPISHVLQWRQLQHAARALSESASLAEAAEAGGFADQSHFARRMRRWFGVAPGAGLSGLEIRVAPTASGC